MLRAYSTNITATANEPIVFNINKFNTDAYVSHASNSSNINIERPGYYEVAFDLTATVPEETADPVVVQLYANGNKIPDAILQSNFTNGSYNAVSFNTVIKANPGMMGQNVTLTVIPSATLTISNTAIGIDRINVI